jgi:mannose-6-phosphate isomerase-like protein (cupin superfamily)
MRRKHLLSIALLLAVGLAMLPNAASAGDSMDHGPKPYAADLEQLTRSNPNFRTALWTGGHLQLTVMSIPARDEIGMEVHGKEDQFFYIVEGLGNLLVGSNRERLEQISTLKSGSGVFVPAGTWHNIVNTGSTPLKLFTIYAPPHHPHGTIHKTKADDHH